MIIVTGGAGFIGSALLWGLNQEGVQDIVVVDVFDEASKWKNLVKRKFREVIHRDQFLAWLKEGKHDIECIFHMGACSSTTEMNMDFLLDNNFKYSAEIFRFCTDKEVPLIYASSGATYGMGEQGFSDDSRVIPSLRPINPYGFSKQIFDTWVLQEKGQPPFWCGLKFFNVYGPNEYHKGSMMSVVAKAYPQIKETGRLKLFKSYKEGYAQGEQLRDFIYVKDVISVMLHLWKHPSLPPGIYNLGTGTARSFGDLGRAVFSAMEQEPNFEWIEMPEEIRNQYQYFTEAKMSRLRTQAQYREPFQTLEDGVRDYVANYLATEDRYL
ncbi:MAG: ADP-glyceromanno-heptose 6-epimerase [Deltaproteobacteria bacterium]|nr:ADP-glyceromanno-heptose 6-epimerase [Deltaproteobacteria bacterium]